MLNDPNTGIGQPIPVPAGSLTAQYVQRKFGSRTRTLQPASVLLNTTPTRIVSPNPRRIELIFLNYQNALCFFSWRSDLNVAQWPPIPVNGGNVVVSADEDGELVTSDWWGYATPTVASIIVFETELE